MLWRTVLVFVCVILAAVSANAATLEWGTGEYPRGAQGRTDDAATPILMAAAPLDGEALESGCLLYANRALLDSQEWQRLNCEEILGIDQPPYFQLQFEKHYDFCKRTLGTEIKNCDRKRGEFIKKCRAQTSGLTSTGSSTQPTTMHRPATPRHQAADFDRKTPAKQGSSPSTPMTIPPPRHMVGNFGKMTPASGPVIGTTKSTSNGAAAGIFEAKGHVGMTQGIRVVNHSSTGGAAAGFFHATDRRARNIAVYAWAPSPIGYAVFALGNVHVDGKFTFNPRTSYYSIPPSDFVPEEEKYGALNRGDVLKPALKGSMLEYEYFCAPVHLPHGAVIKSISAGFYMDLMSSKGYTGPNAPRFDIEVRLVRLSLRGRPDDLAEVNNFYIKIATKHGESYVMSTSRIFPRVVDNSRFSYFVRLCTFYAFWLNGVSIKYEYSAP